jgi:AAHS family 4-hydroxybenzoate transporter-like MFS transporter
MLTMAASAIVGAAALAAFAIGARSTFAILALLAWSGGFINAVQTTMYALAAHVYPTGVRATGIGGAVAFGRIGGVLSAYAGSWALESGGAPRLFALLAATMALVLVALASVRRHIPRGSAAGSPARSGGPPVL